MKGVSIILLLILFINSLFGQNSYRNANSDSLMKEKVKGILDSLTIIRELNVYPNEESVTASWLEIRCINVMNSLYLLPYNEIDKLTKDKQPLIRFIGETFKMRKYRDSLKQYSYEILNDTSHIKNFAGDSLVYLPELTIGKIATLRQEEITIQTRRDSTKKLVISAINDFMNKYLLYPKSFTGIRLNYMDTHDEDENIWYEVSIEYKIKNKNDILEKVTNMVRVTYDFKVVAIARNHYSIENIYAPYFSDWFENYGRTLTQKDKMNLKIKK